MKKLFLSIASSLAVLGAIFALSTVAKAGGGPYIALSSSSGSWTVTSPQDLTVSATVFPTTAKITHIYIYADSTLVQTCTATRQCTATIAHPTVGDHSLFVFAVDSSNAYYYLNGSYTQNFTVVGALGLLPDPTIPTVTLTQTGVAYTGTTGTHGTFIQAIAHGTNLSSIKIVRSDSNQYTITNPCTNMKTTCALGIYPRFTADQAGHTYTYQATITDAAGHVAVSNILTVKVARVAPTTTTTTIQTNLKPTLGTTPSTLSVNKTLTVNGKASNANGVWGVEVRALRSWSKVPLTHRCIMAKNATTGNCSFDIGPFTGHIGGTVKVWVIYWDAKTGLGYSSEMRTITLTK